MTALERRYFTRPSPAVARDLLGCWLVRRTESGLIRVMVSETEAYLGEEDPASHARMGLTGRNRPMFGPPGHAYVYFIYGMHYCFNIVTEPSGHASAVLVRAAMSSEPLPMRLDGPARLCRALAIGPEHNGVDLCNAEQGEIWLESGQAPPGLRTTVGPRIGVRDRTPYRFDLGPVKTRNKVAEKRVTGRQPQTRERAP
jgi:DNA-3-methyladenine glycosylase